MVMEVLIFTAVLLGCIWLAPRKGEAIRWHHVALWALAAGLPVGLNLLHGDRPRDSGIRVDNLAASAREVAIATVVMAGGVLAVGIAAGEFYGRHWTRIIRRGGEFIGVAVIQQYFLQAFVLRRLRQALLPAPAAVAAAAVLFGLVHAPNWVLVGLTAAAGVVWCVLFLRCANILTLSLSHGLLALLVYCAWPRTWHLGMVIGPSFVRRAAESL